MAIILKRRWTKKLVAFFLGSPVLKIDFLARGRKSNPNTETVNRNSAILKKIFQKKDINNITDKVEEVQFFLHIKTLCVQLTKNWLVITHYKNKIRVYDEIMVYIITKK